MKLSPIVAALRERCPNFENRVGGAAEWAAVREALNVKMPSAFVVPLAETPDSQMSPNGYQQTVENSFAVILVVSNELSEQGEEAYDSLDVLRKEVFHALLAWEPYEDADRIEYGGSSLVMLDRYRLAYQLEFAFDTWLDRSDTWVPTRDNAMPDLKLLHIDVDFIDPSQKKDEPDGRIEHIVEVQL